MPPFHNPTKTTFSMARSRVGGSSAKISGVLGSLLYTVGKSSAGGYQQYIANYTGIRTNPNTKYQALARMQIAVIERMVQILSPVLQSSFEGVNMGVNSVNEFAKVNMKELQNDSKEHWDWGAGFCYPEKGREYCAWAPFIISYGSLIAPKAFALTAEDSTLYTRTIEISFDKENPRYIDLRKALGISKEGSFNVVMITGEESIVRTGGVLVKGKLNPSINDYQYLSDLPQMSLLNFDWKLLEGAYSGEFKVSISSWFNSVERKLYYRIEPMYQSRNHWWVAPTMLAGVIWSDKKKSRWCKSSTRLMPPYLVSEYQPFGRSAFEVFRTWWPAYDGETYDELFGRNNRR